MNQNKNITWRIEKVTDTEDNLQHWKTIGLSECNIPELGVHFKAPDGQDVLYTEALKILRELAARSLDGYKIEDGQMIKGLHRYPIFIFKAKTPDHQEYMQIVIADHVGNYPWDPNCEADYKQQITFNTDKVFYLITHDKKRVKQLRKTGILSKLSPDFKKRSDGYIEPAQYIVNNELFVLGAVSTRGGLISYANELSIFCELDDLSIICRDTDYSDPINKNFKEYKEEHLDKDST